MVLLAFAVSCTSPNSAGSTSRSIVRPQVSPWEEVCEGCGSARLYGYTFDSSDYEVIAAFADSFRQPIRLHWLAPSSPSLSCSKTYSEYVSFARLQKELPALRYDTFQDFLTRNDPVPAHRISEWTSNSGVSLRIEASKMCPPGVQRFSRAGFSTDRSQALIYHGGGLIHLFTLRGDSWIHAGYVVLWMS